jgi:hypothetical protein
MDTRLIRFSALAVVGLGAWVTLVALTPTAAQNCGNCATADIVDLQMQQLQSRVAQLETLRADARLSVLETLSEDVRDTQRILYGAIAAIIGQLLLTAFQIRAQAGRRRRSLEDAHDESS